MSVLIYGMVFLGSALMVYNINSYVSYLRQILKQNQWKGGRMRLYFPLILLIAFLMGYIVVGVFGKPDIVMSAILFFGSVYVTIMISVLKSITRHIRENEQLESELRAAEESNRAKTKFLSHMSHEIRTPMNAIIGMNMIALKNPDLPPETREQLEKIDVSAQHMLSLINDILDISRIESGTVELKNEEFRFKDLIDQVSEIIRGQCAEKGLKYECLMQCLTEERCIGDPMKLKQILINILGNSVKFTPEGGSVILTVQADAAEDNRCPVSFFIKDTGEGIDKEYLPMIFDAFSQEDSSATNKYGGTGLGMAITKSLVDLMGGQISVESEKGVGTTFRVDIGLEVLSGHVEGTNEQQAAGQKAVSSGTPDTAEDGVISLEGRRVLFAEDVELNAEILADFLEMEDIVSDWAPNGKAAVELFAASEPGSYDAILMDLRMPEMDGLTATKEIRKLDREDAGTIPIIALTANAFEEDMHQSIEAGMNAHLSKPIDCDMLYEELRRQLAGRQVKQQQTA